MNDHADPIGPIPRWFVVFTGGYELTADGQRIESARRHLVDWLSPRGFWHVFAFAYDAAGKRWLVYEVNRAGAAIVALTSDQFDIYVPHLMAHGSRVLVVDIAHRPRPWLQFGMWCVVAVRHLLGARSRALRPIGLWRDLLRAGAKEAFTLEAAEPAKADAAVEMV